MHVTKIPQSRRMILHGGGTINFSSPEITRILDGTKSLLFIPYARPGGITYKAYTKYIRDALSKKGFNVTGIEEFKNPGKAIDGAEAIFVGGGNTFVLLRTLYHTGLIDAIRERVDEGMPYIGASAGANVAGRSIMTTNDMPIVYPPSFMALGLVPFVINPHYFDPNPKVKQIGESREKRIKEYLAFNRGYVAGLEEGAMLQILNGRIKLTGHAQVKIFHRDERPKRYKSGASLNFMLRDS